MSEIDDSRHSDQHYARLAATYDLLWDHTPQFRRWMAQRILGDHGTRANLSVVDLGGGTGIYAAELLRLSPRIREVVVVDPSLQMLDKVPASDRLRTLHADAEHANEALEEIGLGSVDLVLIKEAVHHFDDPHATLRKLTNLVSDGGSLLVVMLPTTIAYPLFDAALTRFTERQPDPRDVQATLSAAGLDTSIETHGFEIELPTEQWVTMVGDRFMSLLSTFTDAEIARGVDEIRERHRGEPSVRFIDNFAFVRGVK